MIQFDEFDTIVSSLDLPAAPHIDGCVEDRFHFSNDVEVKEVQEGSVPANMKKATSWAMNVCKEWNTGHCVRFANDPFESPPHLMLCSKEDLDRWMSKFVLEARRSDGKVYIHLTLYINCVVAFSGM